MAAMVSDLIRASAPEIKAVRFPSGDKGQVRGFDGWLESTGMPPYVPDGTSIWEFGVAGEKPAKALEDYNKRVRQTGKELRNAITFVFVSPATWDAPQLKLQDWVKERKNEKYWKDVCYIDGSQLEDWLYQCPSVAAYYAAEMGLRPLEGVCSADEFWNEYASRFKTKLSEEVVLAGRTKQASAFLQSALGTPGSIELAADSPDEVIAFAIAAVRKSDPETRLFLEDRILIPSTEHAARFFSTFNNLVYFPRSQANTLSGLLSTKGPTLVSKGRDQRSRKEERLERPSTSEFAAGIETMGLERDAAYALAQQAGRSITVLARRYPRGNVQRPEWQNAGQTLIPAVMAGGWDGSNVSDQRVIAGLTIDSDYDSLDRALRRMAQLQDPPIDMEGSVWKIRAPVDAFVHLGHLFGANDFKKLSDAAITVFSQIDDPLDANAPFVVPSERLVRHSSWLRDGLANTLLQIAVLHEQAEINVPGLNPQQWVNNLISSLPGLRDNHRLISSLKDELWLLMEAAPHPLLEALEHLLEGDKTEIQALFSKEQGLFSPTSPHNYILWALETLAWDPEFFERATIAIAKLALMDTGSYISNRPVDSLRAIFLPWHPNTNASLSLRNAVLHRIVDLLPTVGWTLSLLLLPKAHDTSSLTRKPRFREAGASQVEVLTNGQVWQAQAFVIEIVLGQIGDSGSRWVQVIRCLDQWTPQQQLGALEQLDKWIATHLDQRDVVWSALNDLANKHNAFADAEWALTKDVQQALEGLVVKHESTDAVRRSLWLFDSWLPQMGSKFEENEALANGARSDAVRDVIADRGTEGLLELATLAKEPGLVGLFAADHAKELVEIAFWIEHALLEQTENSRLFIISLSAKALQRSPTEWQQLITDRHKEGYLSDDNLPQLLLGWPDGVDTWNFVKGFGEAVEAEYWKQKRPFALTGSHEELLEGVNSYMRVGRFQASLSASHRRTAELPTDVITHILKSLIQELNTNIDQAQLTQHFVDIFFNELDKRSDIHQNEIARLEYVYFPLLRDRKRKFAIHQLMATDPEFYISLITSIFRAAGEQEEKATVSEERTEGQRAKWSLDYRLLSQFSTLPGADGDGVEFDTLMQWISAVRALGEKSDRKEVTDIYIGHLLAHAPPDPDGAWPHKSVRRVVEQLNAPSVERGIATERFNMRGVYTKSMTEGGEQERELATRYRNWAKTSDTYPRTARLLERIAEGYDHEAKDADQKSNLDRLRY
ncbi:hypothetical protein FZC33_10595 [Labrys sp. KNU-23]|uniref:hypothetical protein n=1 Tax=Labrys sp. KNU-23 TaxID=2789216 RepID=UPI0011EC4676|nr:hypothetical protein [Labrys sp. KNU-23]QEN86749.1 hypothetical protein FZC33_10595 [Labrys sp. KNU-23]